jgi:hypothetical protein
MRVAASRARGRLAGTFLAGAALVAGAGCVTPDVSSKESAWIHWLREDVAIGPKGEIGSVRVVTIDGKPSDTPFISLPGRRLIPIPAGRRSLGLSCSVRGYYLPPHFTFSADVAAGTTYRIDVKATEYDANSGQWKLSAAVVEDPEFSTPR